MTNSVTNGDFETGDTTGWTIINNDSGGTTTATVTTTSPRSGTYCLYVECTANSGSYAGYQYNQALSPDPVAGDIISLWVKMPTRTLEYGSIIVMLTGALWPGYGTNYYLAPITYNTAGAGWVNLTYQLTSDDIAHLGDAPITFRLSIGGTSMGSGQQLITSVDDISVGANYPPSSSFTTSTTSGPCPLTVNFTDTTSNNPTTWLWYFGNGATSASQNPTNIYSGAGTYYATLYTTNSFGSDISDSATITVYGAPAASFTATPNNGTAPLSVNFVDTSSNSPTTWYWLFGDGESATTQNPTHIFVRPEPHYYIALWATNSCGHGYTTRIVNVYNSPVGLQGKFNVIGVSHPATLVGLFNLNGESHPISLKAIFSASHTNISRYWCEIG